MEAGKKILVMEMRLIKNGSDVFIKQQMVHKPFSVTLNSWYTWPKISQNCEITGELKLEDVSGDHSIQPGPMKQQVKQTRFV